MRHIVEALDVMCRFVGAFVLFTFAIYLVTEMAR